MDKLTIATFMLVDLNSVAAVRAMIASAAGQVDFANARVVHMAIGTNFSAGLSADTNRLVHAAQVLPDGVVGADNILLAPYTLLRASPKASPIARWTPSPPTRCRQRPSPSIRTTTGSAHMTAR